jgi:amino acid permease
MADRLISREEVLGGLPARRAGLTLFAIQSRTASLVARSRRAMATYLTPHAAAEREREFLAAMASGRELPLKPSIQDLERYADEWAGLVPADPGLRAAVARLLAEQHAIPRERVPRLCAALGLDEPAVREAFERANRRSPDSLYATELGRGERLRWARARAAERLERLPPFWTAFALTLTECVGAGILALPVAMAGIGPLGAVIVLVVFGLVNVVTVAALVEAITRTGAMRYGTAYFGRLVGNYLGAVGSATIAAAVFALNATVLLVALVGFGAVLEGSTGVPLAVWACILFAGNLFYLRREGLDATVASALVIGAVNIGLIVALSAIGLAHLDAGNFDRVNVPLLDGRPVDTEVLVLIFGVVLLAFFGHTSAANSAKVVLERDPTGRALLWGNVAALLAATLLYALTVLAMTGAVAPADLQGSDGTALEPLAARAGAAVDVLGSAFAILAIGLGSIYCSLALYNQMVEWRPEPDPRRRFLVGTLPAVAVLGVTLAMLAAGSQSFAGPLGYVGALTIPLLGGLFPMLLVVASRRRGELVPGLVPRLVGHPVTAAAIGAIFVAGTLLHGLVIWEGPGERAAALAVAAAMLALSAGAWRRGAFKPRTVIELRREPERDLGHISVTSAGAPVDARIEVDGRPARDGSFARFSLMGTATVELPPGGPEEVAVWAHRVSPGGDSQAVPASVGGDGRTVLITPAAPGSGDG